MTAGTLILAPLPDPTGEHVCPQCSKGRKCPQLTAALRRPDCERPYLGIGPIYCGQPPKWVRDLYDLKSEKGPPPIPPKVAKLRTGDARSEEHRWELWHRGIPNAPTCPDWGRRMEQADIQRQNGLKFSPVFEPEETEPEVPSLDTYAMALT